MKLSYYEDGKAFELCSNSQQNIVIFFSGYRKSSNWDHSEFGKDLGIIRQLHKVGSVVVDLGEEEWLKSIPAIGLDFLGLFEKLQYKFSHQSKIVIVGHSYGCFMALYLGQVMKSIHGVVLLDPVLQDQSYKSDLSKDLNNLDNLSKIANWDLFPRAQLPSDVIVQIHLVNGLKIKDKLDHFLPMCKANTWSVVEVHACSHMIHYDRPHKVIEAIRQLFRIK